MAGALAATVLLVAFAYTLRVLHKEKTPAVPDNLPANVHQQLSGFTFTRSEGGRQIFTVHAARTVAFRQGGTTVLEDVYAEFFGRTGNRRDILRTQRCEYNTESGGLSCLGTVEIELNAQLDVSAATDLPPGQAVLRGQQPVYLEVSKVSFQPQGSLVVSDEPIRFRFGPASGSAVGITYATKAGWLELKKDVVVNLPPRNGATTRAEPNGWFRLSAGGLRYRKETGQVELGGPLEVTEGSRRIMAKRGTIFLDGQNRVTRAVLEGDVRGFDPGCRGGFTPAGWGDRLRTAPTEPTARDVGCGSAHSLTAEAQTVRGDFDPASGQLRNLVAEGDLKAESGGDWGESVSFLSAQEVQVSFVGQHPQAAATVQPARPVNANASGNVQLSLESSAAANASSTLGERVHAASPYAERKDLTASQVLFTFRPEGEGLQEVKTVGPGKLVLISSDPREGRRVITAGQFLMAFDSRSRLESLRGFSPTQIVFEPSADHPLDPPRESSSDQLEATLETATQQLLTVEQVGNFQFREGDRRGSAEQARYSAQTQLLTLTGRPQLWDTDTRARADRFLIDLRTDAVEGLGHVQSTHLERAGGRGSGGEDAAATTNVLAGRMVAEKKSQFVHYEGRVRAWHGYDVVESPSLDVFRKERRISSGSGVVTSHLEPAPIKSGPVSSSSLASAAHDEQRGTRPLTIRADRLEYFDEGHKASYRGHVQAETENTTLKADRMDVYFSSSPAASTGRAQQAAPLRTTGEEPKVERAVADGHVTVVQPMRRAHGEHAEYFAGPGKIVMTGGPPTLYDAEEGFTTGQRLTFMIRDDSLFVDGGEKSPTLSKRRAVQ